MLKDRSIRSRKKERQKEKEKKEIHMPVATVFEQPNHAGHIDGQMCQRDRGW